MTALQIIGAALVVVSSSALGMYYSGLDAFRMQDLLAFRQALTIFASEIEFVVSPLPEAMQNVAKRIPQPVSRLFADFAARLTDVGGETAYRLWVESIAAHKPVSYLDAEDWDAIESFGKTLGYLDKPMQINTIRHTQSYIDGKTETLRVSGDKNKRMYRSLGVVGGILLVVIFM